MKKSLRKFAPPARKIGAIALLLSSIDVLVGCSTVTPEQATLRLYFHVANWMYTRVRTNKPDHTVERGQLWPYHKERKLYWCPLDRTNTALFRAREMQVGSYVMNGAVSGYTTGPRGDWTTYKLAQFQPDSMLYWEADERQPSNCQF